MSTTTIYAATSDNTVANNDTNYATALAGLNIVLGTATDTHDLLGQAYFAPDYTLVEVFFSIDGTSVPAGETVSAITVDLYGYSDNATTNEFTIEMYAYDWSSGGITGADWRTNTWLSSATLLASFDTTPGFSTAAYNTMTSTAALVTGFNTSGTNYYVLSSSRIRTGNAPTGSEFVEIWMGDEGSTKRPRFTVTSAAPSGVTGPAFSGAGFF